MIKEVLTISIFAFIFVGCTPFGHNGVNDKSEVTGGYAGIS